MSAVDPQARIAAIREMLQQQIGEAESSVRARQQYASSDREASDEEEREAAEMATRMSGRPVPARSEAERATSAAIQDRIVAKTVRRLGLLRACLDRLDEADELDASFNLRWKADMRAIERWRAERPHEREFRQPDHADLCVFLLDALASAQAAPPSPCVWQPIETAPKGRRDVLDLWCVGLRDDIEFYCPDYCATGTMEGDEHLYQGRVTNVQWRDGAWRPKHGLRLHALTVTPTHWMRKPEVPHV